MNDARNWLQTNSFGGYLVDQYPYTDSPPDTIGWANGATDLGFVDGNGYSTGDIICHKEGKPGTASADVAAGSSIKWDWTEWPESHHGPVITYMAKCNGDCTKVDKSSLKFFKIEEAGLIDGSSVPGQWASDKLISDGHSWEVTVPSSIAAGNYVMRHEIIALHSAGTENGAQNYAQCINLKVTGGGSDNPEGTAGTALYTPTDPGILINIYEELSDYKIPGPALYKGGNSNDGDDGDSSPPSDNAPEGPSTPNKPTEPSNPSPPSGNVPVGPSTPSKPNKPAEPSNPSPPPAGGFTIPDNLTYNQLLNALRQITNRLFATKRHARDLSASQ